MLKVYLFGKPRVVDTNGRPLKLSTSKVEQLLAFLLVNRDKPQSRQRLAGMFWSESSESKARASLRGALYTLRKTLAPYEPQDAPYFTLARDAVHCNTHPTLWCDVLEFERTLGAAKHQPPDTAVEQLGEAVSLYGGDFLEGCYDDWCLDERDHLEQRYLEALSELVDHHSERRQHEHAIHYAKLSLSKNQLQEQLHRQLMVSYCALGERNAALAQYQTCVQALEEALGVEPLPETQALFHEIQARTADIEQAAARSKPWLKHFPELDAPFVGRDLECGLIFDAWNQTTQGRGQAILIAGEAGAGKTRLGQEVTGYVQAKGGLVLNGRCYEAEGHLPYQPWIEALRRALAESSAAALSRIPLLWLGEVMKLVPELAERFPDLQAPPPLLSPTQERNRLFEAINQVLRALSQQTPLLVILDDLHWADESTLQFAHYLTRRLGQERILLLGFYRLEDVSETYPLGHFVQAAVKEKMAHILTLAPLDGGQIKTLVRGLLGASQAEPRDLTQRLIKRSKGNPFFVVELMRSYTESGALFLTPGKGWQVAGEKLPTTPPPASVKAVVKTRLRRISPGSREVLNLAAIRSRTCNLDFFNQATQRATDDFLDDLEPLVKMNFLTEKQGGYAFQHDVIREVIYHNMLPERRRRLHLKAGEALEVLYQLPAKGHSAQVIGEIAHHFSQANDHDKALEYSLAAGDQAWSTYAKEESLHFYHQAQALAKGAKDEVGLLQAYAGLGKVCCFSNEQEQGLAYCQKALKLCQDPELRADIYCSIANVYHVRRELEDGLAYCEEALKALGANSTTLAAAKAHYYASTFLNWLLRYDEAIVHCERSLKILGQVRDDHLESLVLSELGHAYNSKGNYKTAIRHLTRSAELAKRTGEGFSISYAHFKLAMMHHANDAVPEAIESFTRSLETVSRLGGHHVEQYVLYNHLTYAFIKQADFQQAFTHACKQLRSADRSKTPSHIATAYGMLGCLYDAKGQNSKAKHMFNKALKADPSGPALYYNVVLTYVYLSRISQAIAWLKKGLPHLKERHLQLLASGPIPVAAIHKLRKDPRFASLIECPAS